MFVHMEYACQDMKSCFTFSLLKPIQFFSVFALYSVCGLCKDRLAFSIPQILLLFFQEWPVCLESDTNCLVYRAQVRSIGFGIWMSDRVVLKRTARVKWSGWAGLSECTSWPCLISVAHCYQLKVVLHTDRWQRIVLNVSLTGQMVFVLAAAGQSALLSGRWL